MLDSATPTANAALNAPLPTDRSIRDLGMLRLVVDLAATAVTAGDRRSARALLDTAAVIGPRY